VEWVAALGVVLLRLPRLVALVARLEIALEHEVAVGDRIGVHRLGLHDADREALGRTGRAQLVSPPGQDYVVVATAGDQRASDGEPEAHGDGDAPLVPVVLGDHLPHVRAGRGLEGADVAPAEVHAVVADVAAAMEVVADHHTVAAADGELGLLRGVANCGHVLVDVQVIGDHDLLARRLGAGDQLGRDRVGETMGELPRPLLGRRPTEHAVQDLDVGEEVGDDLDAWVPLDLVEEDGNRPVQVLLDARQLEVGVDLDVRFQEQALLAQPAEAGADRSKNLGLRSGALDPLREGAGDVKRHALPPGPWPPPRYEYQTNT